MITDGTYYCARCGEDRVSCSLCDNMEPALVKRREYESTYDDEIEGMNQERAMRRESDKRLGF